MKHLVSFKPTRQAGVSLIEVMVAAFVLAVGLLGVAALMGNAMQFNQGAQFRTQAILLASDIIERARVNRTERPQYGLDDFAADPMEGFAAGDCAAAAPGVGASLAQRDLAEWQRQLGCSLPGGTATIRMGIGMAITIRWSDTTDNSTEEIFIEAFYE